MTDSLPEWVPDEYDPDDPLAERLPVIAEMDGGVEIHVRDKKGVEYIVHQPQHLHDLPHDGLKLSCGTAPDDWSYEIVVPGEHEPFLREVDPNQNHEAYIKTHNTVGNEIDARLYGVDVDRFEDTTEVPA